MTSSSTVYIVGVGFSPSVRADSSERDVTTLISAATKALLDAGVTFDDVAQGVTASNGRSSKASSQALEAFDRAGIAVDSADEDQELERAVHWVQNRGAQCVLVLALNKSTAVALLLASEDFLWRHPYLKDSAILIHESKNTKSWSGSRSQTDLVDLCRTVWELRGWFKAESATGEHKLTFRDSRSDHAFSLSRADGKAIPKFEEIEHRHDGKSRLGYNPAIETKEVSREDFEAVRAEANNGGKAEVRLGFKRKGGDRAALAKL